MTDADDAAGQFADELAGDLLKHLAVHADPSRAESERAYLKSQRDFLGVSVPASRGVVRTFVREHGPFSMEQVVELVDSLWDGPFFECRRAAVEVLEASVSMLGDGQLPLVAELVRDGETWALVDPLATDVAGPIVMRGVTSVVGELLDSWSVDESFWVRRLSMLSLLPSLKQSDAEWTRFCGYADLMMGEREFFIRKAIGWVLRDISRRRPDDVRAFVMPRLDTMSGVTRREAIKYLM